MTRLPLIPPWTVACCLVVCATSALHAAQPAKPDLDADCAHQYDALQRDMRDNKARGRSARAYHRAAGIYRSDESPTSIMIRRTEALLADIERLGPTRDLAPLAARLDEIKKRAAAAPEPKWKEIQVETFGYGKGKMKTDEVDVIANRDDRYPIFRDLYRLNRQIALANPLLDFDRILFLKRHPAAYSHMVDQIFGITQTPGGGLYVLDDPFGENPTVRDLLAGTVCGNGRFEGKPLTPGSFLSPDVSYDGKRILFSYVEIDSIWPEKWNYKPDDWKPETCFHIFEIGADGQDLRQLTDGPWNDTDPIYLPNGRICFISDRRGGQGRCHPGRMCPSYVLHSMLPDGGDIVPLSYHETNEWHPSVNNFGEILYSRWDYVDRAVTAGQMPWVTKVDGRDARALHGNYDEAKPTQGAWDPVPVPGADSLYVATLSMHHNQSYGSFAMFDNAVWDHARPDEAVKYITPEEGGGHGDGAYATAWPLSEKYYLCVYSPNTPGFWNGGNGKPYHVPVKHGVYLLDAFGNKTLLYRDEEICCLSPMPLRARPMPPRMPHMTDYAFPADQTDTEGDGDAASTIAVMDVYNSLLPWPERRKISALRIVQVYPKPTIGQDRPHIGYASMMNARRSLGTVPVESDGSCHFTMPTKVPVYFQALDENGLAIQSMKSAIYTHPGETLTCQGCHEPKGQPVTRREALPKAMKRKPSDIQPDVSKAEPLIFARLVQPVLDAKCVACHDKNEKAPSLSGEPAKRRRGWSKSYKTLRPYAWFVSGRKDEHQWKAGQRSVPGEVGATVSKLYPMLTTGSHKDKVKLTADELAAIALWLDLNSPFYGAYYQTNEQEAGKLIIPELE